MVTWYRLAALLAIAALGVGLPSSADAQASAGDAQDASRDAEARSLFEAGRAAFATGRFEDALEYFERSFELSGRPELHYNIATCADRLRRDQQAIDAYEAYLEARPDGANHQLARERLAFLRAQQPAPVPIQGAVALEPQQAASEPARSPNVLEEWWFWTLVGVVAVGAGVGIALGVGLSSPSLQAPEPGTGGVVVTLEGT
jgi:tetratricopeptide (TPR) repeat protein